MERMNPLPFHYSLIYLPNRGEEIDMGYYWQIEDQRLATEGNQR
jgi:hypothetical protein